LPARRHPPERLQSHSSRLVAERLASSSRAVACAAAICPASLASSRRTSLV
jgi:hypothetical protein